MLREIAEAALDELQQLHLLRLGMDRLDARCRDLLLLVFRDEAYRHLHGFTPPIAIAGRIVRMDIDAGGAKAS